MYAVLLLWAVASTEPAAGASADAAPATAAATNAPALPPDVIELWEAEVQRALDSDDGCKAWFYARHLLERAPTEAHIATAFGAAYKARLDVTALELSMRLTEAQLRDAQTEKRVRYLDTITSAGTITDAGCDLPKPVCANSIVEPPETCDDGNVDPGDGCSEVCVQEKPTRAPARIAPAPPRPVALLSSAPPAEDEQEVPLVVRAGEDAAPAEGAEPEVPLVVRSREDAEDRARDAQTPIEVKPKDLLPAPVLDDKRIMKLRMARLSKRAAGYDQVVEEESRRAWTWGSVAAGAAALPGLALAMGGLASPVGMSMCGGGICIGSLLGWQAVSAAGDADHARQSAARDRTEIARLRKKLGVRITTAPPQGEPQRAE